MSLETKRVSGLRASFSGKEVIVHPHVHLYSANRAADTEKNPAEELDQLKADRSDAMRHEMTRALHPYVLLRFLPCSEAADKSVALAVIFHQHCVPLIMIRHEWQIGFDAEDRKYLAELMDDWARTPAEQLLALLRQLECLADGPLRTAGSGIATAEALEYLINTVLGNTVPGRWTI